MAVGLAGPLTQPNTQLGTTPDSIALRVDSGRMTDGATPAGVGGGATAGMGDVVGCGWEPHSGEVFFTKNGELARECV